MKANATAKSAHRTTVLLADDDSATRRQLTQLLQRKYEVSSASTAGALAAIKKNEPDLVILDLKSSKVDGLVLLRQLRKVSRNSTVIVLTARSRTSDIPKALKLGADDYLVKPIDHVEFTERVNRAVTAASRTAIPSKVHIKILLPELHDPQTGRIAADKVAKHLAIPLKQLAHAVGANYATVHKTPAADSLQSSLIPVKRSLEILHQLLRNPAAEKAWLNSSHPDLGMRTPLQVILEGNGKALWTILENALEGIPS